MKAFCHQERVKQVPDLTKRVPNGLQLGGKLISVHKRSSEDRATDGEVAHGQHEGGNDCSEDWCRTF